MGGAERGKIIFKRCLYSNKIFNISSNSLNFSFFMATFHPPIQISFTLSLVALTTEKNFFIDQKVRSTKNLIK